MTGTTWVYHKDKEAQCVSEDRAEELMAEGWGDEPYNPARAKEKADAAKVAEEKRLADRKGMKDEVRDEILSEQRQSKTGKK